MPRNFLVAIQRLVLPQPVLKGNCMPAKLGKRKARSSKISRVSQPAAKQRKLASFAKQPTIMYSTERKNVELSEKLVYFATPLKSENDKKEYRALQLSNGMRVLLISDPSISETDPVQLAADGIDNMAYSSAEEEESNDEEGEEEEEDDDGEEEEDEDGSQTDDDSDPDPDSVESNGTEGKNAARKQKTAKEGDRMAAASLCVNVGSFSDPPDLPGLAHFLEHMVFMGSNKYPEENAFDEFLKMYGGSSNASTDCETTTFEFEIHQRHFHDALAIFAEFFASPLLLPESMKREKEAIDSEFQMALPSDACRKQQLFASLAKADHPMGKFMWGNSTTLKLPNDPEGTELNRRLRVFWQEHYRADRMTIVLQSKHDLNQLEEWAASIFHIIPSSGNHPADPPSFENLGAPFDTPKFNQILQVVPVKDVHEVCLSWAMPSQLKNYRIKPLGYLSWLIGHEGKGSLLAYLRRKVWALDLASGNDESGFDHNSTYALFSINISLTERGMAEMEHVIAAVFQYIEMIKSRGPDERIWREIQTIEELSFRYVEDSSPVENVESLSENMHKYSPEDYLSGDSLMFDYNSQVVADCLNALRIDNLNIMVLSKDFAKAKVCDETEPWFQTHFKIKDIPTEWKNLWSQAVTGDPSFAIPDANPYLASDFSLLDNSSADLYPAKIDDPEDESVWYRPDSKFRIPKASVNFYFISPIATDSPQNAALLELLPKILKHQLMERVYDALVAQLELSIHHYDRGLVIKVSGFNHKLHLLVNAVIDQFARFETDVLQDVFDALKEQTQKSYRNYCLKPSKLITDARLTLLHTSHWSVIDKFEAVEKLTVDDMKTFACQLKETFHLECLVQGNYSKDQALEGVCRLKNKLQPDKRPRGPLAPIRICQVPIGERCCRLASFHPTDSNSVVVNYYQVGPTNMHQTAVMEILVNLMEEPVFDVLRTREQLGYNVYATLRNTFGVLGFSITVDFQADKFSASHVDERIEEFLRQFEQRLATMSESDLQTRVQSLVKLKIVPDVSLDEEVSRNWNEILSEEYLFDRLQQEVDHLSRVSLEEIRSFYKRFALSVEGSERRKLSMQVIGGMKTKGETCQDKDHHMGLKFLTEEKHKECFIVDLRELRRSSLIFPPLKTFNGLPLAESVN